MIWESACWGTALGRLVTCPAHLDQPPVRDRWQLPHLITASAAHGAGNRKQSWPHWLSDPISEITTPSPLLFTNEETEDTTLSQGLAQVLLSPTHPNTPQQQWQTSTWPQKPPEPLNLSSASGPSPSLAEWDSHHTSGWPPWTTTAIRLSNWSFSSSHLTMSLYCPGIKFLLKAGAHR